MVEKCITCGGSMTIKLESEGVVECESCGTYYKYENDGEASWYDLNSNFLIKKRNKPWI